MRRETRRPGFPLWSNSPGSPTKAMRLPKSHVGACAPCVQARVPSCQRWGRSFIRLMPLRLHLLLLTALSSDTFATSRNPTSALNPKKKPATALQEDFRAALDRCAQVLEGHSLLEPTGDARAALREL